MGMWLNGWFSNHITIQPYNHNLSCNTANHYPYDR